jgi:hypothetical protein|eukprot:6083242-Prymnesium_polylepis.2
MPTKDELYAFAMDLYESANARTTWLGTVGSVLPSNTLLLANDKKVCIAMPEVLNGPAAVP